MKRTMTHNLCRFCGSGERISVGEAVQYCPLCCSFGMYPLPSGTEISRLANDARQKLPVYDDDFEWRIFLLRALLKGKGSILEIGRRTPNLHAALAREGFVCMSAATPAQATGENRYDAVIIWDELENDPDPFQLIEGCRNILREGGYLLVRVEDSGSLRNMGGIRCARPRLNHLSRKSLELMFMRGFRVQPLFIQMERQGRDFLVCAIRKGDSLSSPSQKVLMVAHPDAYTYLDDAPGPRMRIFKTMLNLRSRGVAADLCLSPYPQAGDYDLVHLFHHAWKSGDNLQQALCAKYADKPLVISAIYMELSETNFALRAIPKIFGIPAETERNALLRSLEKGTLRLGELTASTRIPTSPDTEENQKMLFSLADHLIGLSLTEIRQIGLTLGIHKPFSIVPNCADPAIFYQADPAPFVHKYGISDFIISVAHIEGRKNQLMLLYALRNTGLPIVVVGAPHRSDPEYYDLCRHFAPADTLFIPQLTQPELASAFAAARVHALPSWNEGASLANIEAAMAGCNLLVSNRAGEWEYYRDEGFYCNPAGIESIREGVEMAYRLGDGERRRRLKERVSKELSFEVAAAKTVEAYQKAKEEKSHERKTS